MFICPYIAIYSQKDSGIRVDCAETRPMPRLCPTSFLTPVSSATAIGVKNKCRAPIWVRPICSCYFLSYQRTKGKCAKYRTKTYKKSHAYPWYAGGKFFIFWYDFGRPIPDEKWSTQYRRGRTHVHFLTLCQFCDF